MKIEAVETQESIRQMRRLKKLQFEIREFISLVRVKNGLKEEGFGDFRTLFLQRTN